MTLTRSQLGETPKKTEHPGFVETPSRRTRSSRQSTVHNTPDTNGKAEGTPSAEVSSKRESNGHANGSMAKNVKSQSRREDTKQAEVETTEYEFGGPWGVSAMMIGFPLLMYYMWIGATYYDGHFPTPAKGESFGRFLRQQASLVYQGAFPSIRAWMIYWVFLGFEAICYLQLPGVTRHGKPLKHLDGKRLEYYCSGMWSFYTTIAVAVVLHVTGVFKLYTIMDEFGPIMSVAIISGFLASIALYVSALYRGVQTRMTGSPLYDLFMGAELNPRLFGLFDLKMFFEVRLPWFILFLLSLGTAARQYEQFGYVSGEVGFMLMAHFLYTNACAKAEEAIITTWDMYHEKLGFMLTFWNMAGVPFSYCTSTVYLANHAPSIYRWHPLVLAFLYISYLFVYWVWDTCNAQKNRFRQQERGTLIERKTFPQLPWQTVQNPQKIPTRTGDSILVDGWYGMARKVHYTCDMYFAFTWGLITGFGSPFPYFYIAFFFPMILHRAWRDNIRCQERYQEAWTEYRRRVPYVFVPYLI